jgi:hypothetical protein
MNFGSLGAQEKKRLQNIQSKAPREEKSWEVLFKPAS